MRAVARVPLLIAVETATTDVVDSLLEGARAELASLALQVRLESATAAEAEAHDLGCDDPDTWAFLTASLAQRVDAERAEMARALDQALADGAARVRAAHAEAMALLLAVQAEVLGDAADPTPHPLLDAPAPSPPPPSAATLAEGHREGNGNGHVPRPSTPAALPEPLALLGTAAAPAPRAGRRRRGLRRFLYVDTILPMVAVLIILVILIAWIG